MVRLWAQTKTKGNDIHWLNHMGYGTYSDEGTLGSKKRNTVSDGLSVQINPIDHLVVDIGYKGVGSSDGFNNKTMNAVNIGDRLSVLNTFAFFAIQHKKRCQH